MANIKVITKPDFKNRKWHRVSDHGFTKNDSLCPITIHELPYAMKSMATGFIKKDSDFVLVAILGLTQNTNLYVTSDNKWINRYLPVAYRTYPFYLLPIEDTESEMAFCVDLDSGLVTEGDTGEAFFNSDGELAADLQKLLEFLRDTKLRFDATAKCCTLLAELDLIKPWQIVTGSGEQQTNVDGLFSVDENALSELPDDKFLRLRHAGVLPLVYCQLLSMRNLEGIKQLSQMSQNPQSANVDELDFSLHGDDGNLQFD